MDLKLINDTIDELESKVEISLSDVRNLSALYTVKNHLVGSKAYDSIVKELNDILPSYLTYIDTKRRYQMKEIEETNVLLQLGNVCKEIKEFIQTLYSGTDTPEERKIIQDLIKGLKEIL